MRLYTDKLSRADLERIAEHIGIQIYNHSESSGPRQRGRFAGKMLHEFILRPGLSDDYRAARLSFDGRKRRIWAVSWAGHYVFMRIVFNLDTEAVIQTGLSLTRSKPRRPIEYNGADEFAEHAYDTRYIDIGSKVQRPLSIGGRQAQADGHIDWYNEGHLIALAAEAVRDLIPEVVR
jgi:hypothetical protein